MATDINLCITHHLAAGKFNIKWLQVFSTTNGMIFIYVKTFVVVLWDEKWVSTRANNLGCIIGKGQKLHDLSFILLHPLLTYCRKTE